MIVVGQLCGICWVVFVYQSRFLEWDGDREGGDAERILPPVIVLSYIVPCKDFSY